MNLTELKEQLEAIGFTTARNPLRGHQNECTWYAYRRSAIPARECECNDGKPAQIVITPYEMTIQGHHILSADVEIRGQCDIWWSLQAYSLSFEELIEKLPEIEAGLIRAWNALEKPA